MKAVPVAQGAPLAAARYIESLSRELKDIAGKADLGMLSYLLDMVVQEAGTVSERLAGQEIWQKSSGDIAALISSTRRS